MGVQRVRLSRLEPHHRTIHLRFHVVERVFRIRRREVGNSLVVEFQRRTVLVENHRRFARILRSFEVRKAFHHGVMRRAVDDREPLTRGIHPHFTLQILPVQGEQIVFHCKGRIIRKGGAHLIPTEVRAVLVCWGEGPELMIELAGVPSFCRVELRDRLHRPPNRVTGDVFHHRME